MNDFAVNYKILKKANEIKNTLLLSNDFNFLDNGRTNLPAVFNLIGRLPRNQNPLMLALYFSQCFKRIRTWNSFSAS